MVVNYGHQQLTLKEEMELLMHILIISTITRIWIIMAVAMVLQIPFLLELEIYHQQCKLNVWELRRMLMRKNP